MSVCGERVQSTFIYRLVDGTLELIEQIEIVPIHVMELYAVYYPRTGSYDDNFHEKKAPFCFRSRTLLLLKLYLK